MPVVIDGGSVFWMLPGCCCCSPLHGTLAGEPLVEDDAQVEHSVLMAYVGLGLDGDEAQGSFNEWPSGMGLRWSPGPHVYC